MYMFIPVSTLHIHMNCIVLVWFLVFFNNPCYSKTCAFLTRSSYTVGQFCIHFVFPLHLLANASLSLYLKQCLLSTPCPKISDHKLKTPNSVLVHGFQWNIVHCTILTLLMVTPIMMYTLHTLPCVLSVMSLWHPACVEAKGGHFKLKL